LEEPTYRAVLATGDDKPGSERAVHPEKLTQAARIHEVESGRVDDQGVPGRERLRRLDELAKCREIKLAFEGQNCDIAFILTPDAKEIRPE
jgi:hypothetical protein